MSEHTQSLHKTSEPAVRTRLEYGNTRTLREALYERYFMMTPLAAINNGSHINRLLKVVELEPNADTKEKLLTYLDRQIEAYQKQHGPNIPGIMAGLLQVLIRDEMKDVMPHVYHLGLRAANRETTPSSLVFFDCAVEHYRSDYSYGDQPPNHFKEPPELMSSLTKKRPELITIDYIDMCDDFIPINDKPGHRGYSAPHDYKINRGWMSSKDEAAHIELGEIAYPSYKHAVGVFKRNGGAVREWCSADLVHAPPGPAGVQ